MISVWSLNLCVGVPDLVPDQYRFRTSLETRFWVDRIPLYYLSCALEEGCLSSSAVGAETSEVRYVIGASLLGWLGELMAH